jgi:hypothetical protein
LPNIQDPIVEQENDYLLTIGRYRDAVKKMTTGIYSTVTIPLTLYWTILLWLKNPSFREGFFHHTLDAGKKSKKLWHLLFPEFFEYNESEAPESFLIDKLLNLNIVAEVLGQL